MYELYHGSNRLVWALYSVRDNKRVIKTLAHIFKRWDVQLVQDIEALHDYIEIKNNQEERRKEMTVTDFSTSSTFKRKKSILQ